MSAIMLLLSFIAAFPGHTRLIYVFRISSDSIKINFYNTNTIAESYPSTIRPPICSVIFDESIHALVPIHYLKRIIELKTVAGLRILAEEQRGIKEISKNRCITSQQSIDVAQHRGTPDERIRNGSSVPMFVGALNKSDMLARE